MPCAAGLFCVLAGRLLLLTPWLSIAFCLQYWVSETVIISFHGHEYTFTFTYRKSLDALRELARSRKVIAPSFDLSATCNCLRPLPSHWLSQLCTLAFWLGPAHCTCPQKSLLSSCCIAAVRK